MGIPQPFRISEACRQAPRPRQLRALFHSALRRVQLISRLGIPGRSSGMGTPVRLHPPERGRCVITATGRPVARSGRLCRITLGTRHLQRWGLTVPRSHQQDLPRLCTAHPGGLLTIHPGIYSHGQPASRHIARPVHAAAGFSFQAMVTIWPTSMRNFWSNSMMGNRPSSMRRIDTSFLAVDGQP